MDIYAQLQALEPGKYAVVKTTRFRWLERFLIKGYVVRLKDEEIDGFGTQSDLNTHSDSSTFLRVAVIFTEPLLRTIIHAGNIKKLRRELDIQAFDDHLGKMLDDVTFRKVEP